MFSRRVGTLPTCRPMIMERGSNSKGDKDELRRRKSERNYQSRYPPMIMLYFFRDRARRTPTSTPPASISVEIWKSSLTTRVSVAPRNRVDSLIAFPSPILTFQIWQIKGNSFHVSYNEVLGSPAFALSADAMHPSIQLARSPMLVRSFVHSLFRPSLPLSAPQLMRDTVASSLPIKVVESSRNVTESQRAEKEEKRHNTREGRAV